MRIFYKIAGISFAASKAFTLPEVNTFKTALVFFLIVFATSITLPSIASAYEDITLLPSGIGLSEYSTEHFHIIYQDTLRAEVPFLSNECEKAYSTLTPIFRWYPKEKIDVIFVDTFDTHNGWATVIPHNRIGIFIAPSEPGSTIYQSGNYLSRTIYHELTHVLSMDTRYGYNNVFSKIFGKINPINGDLLSLLMFYFSTSPVALAPEWYLEGIAIWSETEFSSQGRGRSSLVDMIFRCAVIEQNPLPYGKWDLQLPFWPYSLGAYLYGMKLVQYIDKEEKPQAVDEVGDLVQDLAHSFMFNFDNHSRKSTVMSIDMLKEKMILNEYRVQREKIQKLSSMPFTEVKRLTSRNLIVYSPLYVGDRIFFIAREEESRDTLYTYDPQSKETKKIHQVRLTAGYGSLCRSPDNRYIYYTRLEKRQNGIYWYEIRRFDIKSRTDCLITNKGRYKAVDISPDGLWLTAVNLEAGKCLLAENRLENAPSPGMSETLVKGAFQEDISSPRYSPDGMLIAFVKSDEDGFSLNVYDREKKRSESVYRSQHQILFPTWCHNKKSIVFSSDENGVYNLYEISLENPAALVPLTHVTGGVFSMDFSPDGKVITATAYDNDGYFLTMIPYVPRAFVGKSLPSVDTRWQVKERRPIVIAGEPKPVSDIFHEQPYSSFRNMQFDYWSPWLTASNNGIVGGLEGGLSDSTGYQNLHLIGGVESYYGTPIGSAEYIYRGLYPSIHLFINQNQAVYPNLVRTVDNDYFDYAEVLKTLGTAIDIPLIQKMDCDLALQIGYQFTHPDAIGKSTDKFEGKEVITPSIDNKSEGAVWSELRFQNGTVFGRSNSIEDGRIITLAAEKTAPGLGGEVSRSRYLGQWNEYVSNPWVRNHILKISGIYGIGKGDETATGLFGIGGYYNPLLPLGLPRSIPLRGYEENFQVGDNLTKVSLAYRFPIFNSFSAETSSMAIYYRQIFGEIFYDGGMAWGLEDCDNKREWIDSRGLEINLAVKLLRFLQIAPGIGFVYAPDQERDGHNENGKYQIYLTVKAFVNE